MKSKYFIIAAIIALILVGIWYYESKIEKANISNFDECVAAGNPIMESYPAQCRTKDGRIFTQELTGENPPTSADGAPPGSIHNLPVPKAVEMARKYAAEQAKVEESEVQTLTAFEKEWPNACLGLSGKGEMCAQVITPGYEVTLRVKGQEIIYRTNLNGLLVRQVELYQ